MKPLKSDSEKLTISDAARALDVCRRTILKGVKAGLLVPIRGGLRRRVYWVTRASVDALIEKGGAA